MDKLLIRASHALFIVALWSFLIFTAPFPCPAATSIGLEWNPNLDNQVVGYNVYYGTTSHRYTNVIPAGFATGIGISGLVEGTTYFFAVTAHDALGLESVPSAEVTYQVPRPASGTYSGLFYQNTDVGPATAGYFLVSVTAQGSYSAQLLIGSNRYTFSGKLDAQGRVLQIIPRPGARPLAIVFTVGTDQQRDEIIGQVTDGTWIAGLSGGRATFNARTNAAPFAGNYTLALFNDDTNPTVPMGSGYGTLRVNSGGVAFFAGALSDGTKVSRSSPVSKSALWPLFVPFSRGQGMLIGQAAITNQVDSDLDGSVSWVKLSNPTARYYAGGFTNQCRAIGSVYVKPPGLVISALHLTDAQVIFSGGNLSQNFTNSIRFLLNNYINNFGNNELLLHFSLSSGVFQGRVKDPVTDYLWPFSGVAVQKLRTGYGFLLGTNQSSRVEIGPP